MAAESHVLDGLSFTNANIKIAEPPTFVPAPVRLDWVGGVDSDGTIPVDAGRSDNSVLTIPLRVSQTQTADQAWQQLGLIIAKLDQTRRSSTGLTHLWRPQDATSTWELTVRSGEIVEFPMDDRGAALGYLKRFPRLTVVLYCDPFMKKQGEVVDFTEVTSTEPVFSISLANVPGHVDAEAIVTVTDNATQARRHVECGMGPTSAAALLIDSASLVTSGFAGVASSPGAGWYAGTSIGAFVNTQIQALCGTGNLTHVGPHRIKARINAQNPGHRIRFVYRIGDGGYSYTPWKLPVVGDSSGLSEIDFGVINIATVGGGAQQWDGRIEFYNPTPLVSNALSIDYLLVLPAERTWKMAAQYLYRAGLLAASDSFTSFTAGTVLAGRVSSGQTWATSGVATDFVAADAPLATDETVARSTTTDAAFATRWGLFGAATYANVEVGASIYRTSTLKAGAAMWQQGIVARWTNSTNFFRVYLNASQSLGIILMADVIVAGALVSNVYTETMSNINGNTWYKLRVVIFPSGTWKAVFLDATGAEIATIEGQHSALATGGALATGQVGIHDAVSGLPANTRYFDDFYVSAPPVEPLVINSGRATEFRHDSAYRTSSDGLTRGLINPRGARAFVAPAGPEARITRLWTKARRNNVDVAADSSIADSTKLDVQLRPRYRMPTHP